MDPLTKNLNRPNSCKVTANARGHGIPIIQGLMLTPTDPINVTIITQHN